MYYKKCKFCKANLDPGEKCDCRKQIREQQKKVSELLFTENDGQMMLMEVSRNGMHTRI